MSTIPSSRLRTISRERLSIAVASVVALLYATCLTLLPVDAFLDRFNYLNYAQNASAIFDSYYHSGLLSAIANEPLWLGINVALSTFMDGPDVVRTIVFFASSVVGYVVIRRTKSLFLAIIILFLPQVLENQLVHLRQGVAVAVFLLAWYNDRPRVRIALFALCPLIHASFFFIVAMLTLTRYLERTRISIGLRALVFALSGLVLGFGGQLAAVLAGARQAEMYDSAALNISGLGFAFWLGMLVVMFLEGRTFHKRYVFELACLVFYLSIYFISPLAGRIFEGVVVLVLIACGQLTRWRKATYVIAITAFGLGLYAMHADQAWFGFGA